MQSIANIRAELNSGEILYYTISMSDFSFQQKKKMRGFKAHVSHQKKKRKKIIAGRGANYRAGTRHQHAIPLFLPRMPTTQSNGPTR